MQIGWDATLMEHSKLCRRGIASWTVRCDTPPPAYAFPLTFGYQRFIIQKQTMSKTEAERRI
eukprot:1160222-Amphidinium_carterae.1